MKETKKTAKEIKKQVESILRGYPAMRRELKALEFEFQRFTSNVHPERIRDLTFSRSGGERVSGSKNSDKTADIAIEHYDSQINGEYHALRTLIGNMRFELDRVDHYLSLLHEKETEIIQAFYFEGLSMGNIAEKSHCSLRSVERDKAKGLGQIIRFYSMLDKLGTAALHMRAKICFISYIHEERFNHCLNLASRNGTSGIEAMLYILSGCNELWNAGLETFYDFEAGVVIGNADSAAGITDNGRTLLELAHHMAAGFERSDLVFILQKYFPVLGYVYLELAIEALKIVLFPPK